jgi:hypothetical protein
MLIGYKLQYQDLLPMTYSFLADMGDGGDELLLRDHYHASNHADFAMPSSRATIQDSKLRPAGTMTCECDAPDVQTRSRHVSMLLCWT